MKDIKIQSKKTLFFIILTLSLFIFIFGITRERKIGDEGKVVEHYELIEIQNNASTLCLSCMGIE